MSPREPAMPCDSRRSRTTTYTPARRSSARRGEQLSPERIHQLLVHPGSPVGRYRGMVVVTLGVDPEAVIGDPVPLVTALIQGLQVTQDICVGDQVSLATAQDDRGTVPVQQLVDQNAHTLVTTNPTAWLPALKVGPHGFSRPGHRAHQKVVAARGFTQ